MVANGKELQATETNEGVTLAVTGRATIHVVAELKGRLMTALGCATRVTIDVSAITGADASFFQLLCAAHRTARATGVCLTLSAGRAEAFARAAGATGFNQTDCGSRNGDCIL